MRNEYMEDCIHLHACRRLCKIHKIKSRGCNIDCTAYEGESTNKIVDLEEAKECMYYALDPDGCGNDELLARVRDALDEIAY